MIKSKTKKKKIYLKKYKKVSFICHIEQDWLIPVFYLGGKIIILPTVGGGACSVVVK
jgi:hypothetical protein